MEQNLSTLIGLIYEGPIEPNPWQGFAAGLRLALDARNVAITLHHPTDDRRDIYIMDGIPNDQNNWSAAETIWRTEFMKNDPVPIDRMVDGEIHIVETSNAEPKRRSLLESLDISHNLKACIKEPGGLRCWISITRGRQHPEKTFSATDLSLIRELMPHMTRALTLYAKLKWEEVEKAIYKGMVDHFGLGCVLLNDAGEVLHINSMAESIIDGWPGISVVHGRLKLTERSEQGALNDAIGAIVAARQLEGATLRGELVHVGNCDGRRLGLLVYPAPVHYYYRSEQAPSIIVYLSELTANLKALHPTQAYSLRRIGQLFSLTPQESTLALLLAYGHTIAEAAGEMQIAETTARNYSKRIYAKIGIGSQADLVRLMLRSFSFLR